ncbi:MAG: leucine-rich repeat domain-containing protein, partial [Lachnospiraceae bacterium]|nr:leucine-rich repeat domain-containing protein [Lachnospiraceae bacterium]
MKQKLKRKLLAGLLSICMILQIVGITPVYAVENQVQTTGEAIEQDTAGETAGETAVEATDGATEEKTEAATGETTEEAAEATTEKTTEEATEATTEETIEEATQPATDSDTQEQKCLCNPVVFGEGVHTNKECPYYKIAETTEISEEEQTPVEKLIVMIDALPDADEITDENREAAKAALEEVFAEYEKLLADETITDLDGQLGAERMQKLTALREVLLDMVNLTGEVYGLLKDNTGTVYPANADGTQTDGESIVNNTVTHLFVGSDVTKIAISAFEECTNLKEVDLSKATKLVTIRTQAFYNCTNLTEVNLSKATALQTIEDQAFYGTGIASITIPENVTGINASAFCSCTGLTEVNLSNAKALGTIDKQAFQDCGKLTTIDLSSATALKEIGDQAFQKTGITSITIPESVTKIGGSAFASTGITEITIPASVTEIETDTFSGCKNLTTIDLSKATKLGKIGDRAFQQTGIKSITIPASVTEIGMAAFNCCKNLTTITFKSATPPNIGQYVFNEC